jgi:hypothetical protein
MIPRATDDYDELIDEELCAYQAALEQGIVTFGDTSFGSSLPEGCREEFKKLQHCLDVLYRYRGSSNSATQKFAVPPVPGEYYIPSHIGRFPIARRLGSGGCGIVFLGVDPKIGRKVAIKFPRPELLGSQELIDRFLQQGNCTLNP